jgi:hypothetical protein
MNWRIFVKRLLVCATAVSRENQMNKNLLWTLVAVAAVSCFSAGQSQAQGYPILDQVAQHVIDKYQSSCCAQFAGKRRQPPSPMEQRAVQMMRNDPSQRNAFIERVAAPIANKLFECHLIL